MMLVKYDMLDFCSGVRPLSRYLTNDPDHPILFCWLYLSEKRRLLTETQLIMAPVAVPTMDDLKLDDPKVEKKPEVVNDEEGDDDEEDEAEGGDGAAAGGGFDFQCIERRRAQSLTPAQMRRRRKRRRSVCLR